MCCFKYLMILFEIKRFFVHFPTPILWKSWINSSFELLWLKGVFFKYLTFSFRCRAPWAYCTLCFGNCAGQFPTGATVRSQPVTMSGCRVRLNHSSHSRAHGYALLVTLRYHVHHREIDISHTKPGQQIQTCFVNVISSLPLPLGLLTVCISPCLRPSTHMQDLSKGKASTDVSTFDRLHTTPGSV